MRTPSRAWSAIASLRCSVMVCRSGLRPIRVVDWQSSSLVAAAELFGNEVGLLGAGLDQLEDRLGDLLG